MASVARAQRNTKRQRRRALTKRDFMRPEPVPRRVTSWRTAPGAWPRIDVRVVSIDTVSDMDDTFACT
jgi:hypothetical protein